MKLKDALDSLKTAFNDFEIAARSDDKTPLQNALALSEAKENFAGGGDNPNIFIFADINNFKSINDSFGYDAGDAAINGIGKIIHEILVEKYNAQAFRQSGDEFVILLQSQYLEQFQSAVVSFKSCNVQFGKEKFSVALSFGYSISDGISDFETIRARAELACKEAKKQGDGAYVEWTEIIERNQLQTFRKNCPECNTVTSCYVPMEMNLNSVRFCAACGIRLS